MSRLSGDKTMRPTDITVPFSAPAKAARQPQLKLIPARRQSDQKPALPAFAGYR
jgi:hypothetical protein